MSFHYSFIRHSVLGQVGCFLFLLITNIIGMTTSLSFWSHGRCLSVRLLELGSFAGSHSSLPVVHSWMAGTPQKSMDEGLHFSKNKKTKNKTNNRKKPTIYSHYPFQIKYTLASNGPRRNTSPERQSILRSPKVFQIWGQNGEEGEDGGGQDFLMCLPNSLCCSTQDGQCVSV